MSKEGSLSRIAKYKRLDLTEHLESEEKFFNENYGSPVKTEPVIEKKESSKKSK